ncbi:hypothetical protein [Geotalea sp. SG265]|uniref:hypothetical protein n=1 Tax=Geotalea sp. SG265 TaxID=2922867 RepID=UPI001FB030C2|nr:hypothetical protein [Geotalea sp. SG265]
MSEVQLIHQTHMELDGAQYQIMVFCRKEGSYFAQTFFDDDDIIISDGPTMLEALKKHERLLPLAVVSRQLRRYPSKPRTTRV